MLGRRRQSNGACQQRSGYESVTNAKRKFARFLVMAHTNPLKGTQKAVMSVLFIVLRTTILALVAPEEYPRIGSSGEETTLPAS